MPNEKYHIQIRGITGAVDGVSGLTLIDDFVFTALVAGTPQFIGSN